MDVKLPRLGEGADSGTIVTIMVKEGDRVKKSQTILELENEKAVAPIPSPADGVVSKIHVKEGDKISVGQLLVSLAGDGAAAPAAPSSASKPAPAAPRQQDSAPARIAPEHAASGNNAGSGDYQYSSKSGAPVPASPTVRRVARELGIDLARIRGSERGGRVSIADLRAYVQWLQESAFRQGGAPAPARAAVPQAESVDFSKWGPVTKKPLTSLRKTIAQKMHESWTSIPHVTQFDDADVTALLALRKKYAPAYEKKGAALTLTSFVLKAAVAALKKYPVVNSSLDEAANELVTKQYYHLGVAVDTEQGLIVPVLKDADKKSLLELTLELGALAEKTRQRKVGLEDLKGGCFTISNLGGIGGTYFTPIVNRPEVAILGVGRGVTRPVAINGAVEIRTMLPLGLSYDHRVVDGADGARFIREIAVFLESFKEEYVKI